MKLLIKIIFISLFPLISCNSQQILKIDIEKGIDKNDYVTCSDFIDKFDYIALETNDQILIDANPEVFVYKKIIVIKTLRNCYLFDRDSGDFIREIGLYGRGPGEFNSTRGPINPITDRLFFMGWSSNLLEYDFNGNLIKSIEIPDYVDDLIAPSLPTEFSYLEENIICYYTNCLGDEKKLMVLFDEEGERIHTYLNINTFPKSSFSFSTKEAKFYHYNSNLFFKENYNDTIFRVESTSLAPSIVLNTGKYRKPYESKWMSVSQKQNNEYITPFDIMESDSYLFFKFYFEEKLRFCFYDKGSMILKTTELEFGLNNDLDNFIPFIPVSVSDRGELIGLADGYIVHQWFLDNPDKENNLPEEIKKLQNLKETDNPILIIAKLKQ